jgi:hypothetical protein
MMRSKVKAKESSCEAIGNDAARRCDEETPKKACRAAGKADSSLAMKGTEKQFSLTRGTPGNKSPSLPQTLPFTPMKPLLRLEASDVP